jgi:hypothetical protein
MELALLDLVQGQGAALVLVAEEELGAEVAEILAGDLDGDHFELNILQIFLPKKKAKIYQQEHKP